MKIKMFVLYCLVVSFIVPSVAAQENERNIEHCLVLQHGVMMQCIQKGVEGIGIEFIDAAQESMGTPWQAPQGYVDRTNPVPGNDFSFEEGKQIYLFHCSACHGIDGRGQGSMGKTFGTRIPDLTTVWIKNKTDGALFWKITEGSWPMPAFWEGDTLSEEELWHLINYLRSLSVKE
jgi:mono/diheme cytochrome c family protein